MSFPRNSDCREATPHRRAGPFAFAALVLAALTILAPPPLSAETLAAAPAVQAASPLPAAPPGVETASAEQPAAVPPNDTPIGGAAAPAPIALPAITVTVPSIEATAANVSVATLRAIFAGDVAAHADELAHLTAGSIRIPTLTVAWSGGSFPAGAIVYRDIALDRVKDGVAESATVGGATFTVAPLRIELGRGSAAEFDLGAVLAFYGLVPAPPGAGLRTVYKDLTLDGGSLSSPQAVCTFGRMAGAEVAARPLKTSLAEMVATVRQLLAQTRPSAELIARLAGIDADALGAVRMSPTEYGGFACSRINARGAPSAVAVGTVDIGAFSGPRYPRVTANDITVAATDGSLSIGRLSLAPIDFTHVIEALQQAAGAPDAAAWLQTHVRKLIPEYGGLSLSGVRMDVPSPEHPEEGVRASMASLHLALSDYRNGIPTWVRSSIRHLVMDLPPRSRNKDLQPLIDAGIRRLDLGYDFSADWDEATGTITIDRLAVDGEGLGSATVSVVLGNASPDLFSDDVAVQRQAAMALTVKRIGIEVTDLGLSDLILARTAKEQNTTVKALRTQMSGMALAGLFAALGGSPDVMQAANAFGTFINGGTSLSATLTSKQPGGVGMEALAALQSDPRAFDTYFSLQATAK